MNKFLIALFLLILSAGNGLSLTLKFAEFSPNRGIRAEALKNFAKKIEKESNGELKINFFWGGGLLKTKSILKGVGDGVAEIGSVVGFLTPQALQLYTLGDLPIENSDEWVGMRALYELIQKTEAIQKQFKQANVIYLSNYTTGPIQLICKKPISTISELAKIRIRASGSYGKILGNIGGNIQKLSQPQVYQALQTNLIDCNQNYYYSIKAYKQYEVASNLLELDWGQNMSFGIVINSNTFAKLKNSQQKLLKKLGSEFIDDFAKVMITQKQTIKNELLKGIDGYSLKIKQISKKDKTILATQSKIENQKWIQKNKQDGAYLYKKYLTLIEKYQKIKQTQGYPWEL